VEHSETKDDAAKWTLTGSFALHVAICEYVSPDALYDQLSWYWRTMQEVTLAFDHGCCNGVLLQAALRELISWPLPMGSTPAIVYGTLDPMGGGINY